MGITWDGFSSGDGATTVKVSGWAGVLRRLAKITAH
jgi:hypothetical protein